MSEQKISQLFKEQKFEQAERFVLELLNKESKNLKYIFYYGIILAQKKNYDKALEKFHIVINEDTNHYDSNFNAANCYQGLLNFDKAIEYYNRCLKIIPDKWEPFLQIGVCYRQSREYKKSIYYLLETLKILPSAHSYYVLGNVYREMGNFEDAEKTFILSLKQDEKYTKSKISLANLEIDRGDYKKSIIMLNEVLVSVTSSKNNMLIANVQMAKIYMFQGDYSKAIKINQQVLEEDPRNTDALYNQSICYLFMKEFEKAWKLHEERFNLDIFVQLKQISRSLYKPRWDENRPKKNILIYSEQGIGDQILYSQFIEVIQNQFVNITLAVNNKLIPFFEKIFLKCKIIDYKKISVFQNYDFHLPMGSLGLFFQSLITKNNLQKRIGYEPNSKRIPKKIKKVRCGVSWKSTNKLTGLKKSINLNKLRDLFLHENIEFINLQYSDEKEEINKLEDDLKKTLFTNHNINCFEDIDGVAGLINSCDFVITVSNSNAHISGKLGVKTFLLLPQHDGKLWYWGLNTDTEIDWYPSIKPLRQDNDGHWDNCISLLSKEIENYL